MRRSDVEDLIPLYFRGALSPLQRKEFTKALLEDQDLYDRFAEQQILHELVADSASRNRAMAVLSTLERESFWTRIVKWDHPKLISSVLAIVLGVFVSLRFLPFRNDRDGVQTEEKHSARYEAIRFPLSPTERGKAETNVLRMPSHPTKIIFSFSVEDQLLASYSATINRIGTGKIKTFKDLHPLAGKNSQGALNIILDSSFLLPGDYTLVLYSSDDLSQDNMISGYSFLVTSR